MTYIALGLLLLVAGLVWALVSRERDHADETAAILRRNDQERRELLERNSAERAELLERIQRPERIPPAEVPGFVLPEPEPDEYELVGTIQYADNDEAELVGTTD